MATLWTQASDGLGSETVDTGCTTSLNTTFGNLLTCTVDADLNSRAFRGIAGSFSPSGTEGRMLFLVQLPATSTSIRLVETFSLAFAEGPWRLSFQNNQFSLRVSAAFSGSSALTTTTAFSINPWNKMVLPVEVAWKEASGTGYCRLYVGGTLVASHENLTSGSTTAQFGSINYGCVVHAGSATRTVKMGQGKITNDATTALWTRNSTPVLAHSTKYGFHQDLGYVSDATLRLRSGQALEYVGAAISRSTMLWELVEPTSGATYDWSRIDAIVDTVTAAGAEPMFYLGGSPNWANGGTRFFIPGTGVDSTFTTWADKFKTFCVAAVNRYKPGGTYGSSVVKWEIWNEQNLPQFWTNAGTDGQADQYTYLYNLLKPAIEGASSQAQVAIGGFSTWLFTGGGYSGMELLGEMLLRGATFTRCAIHSYDSGTSGPLTDVDFTGNMTDFASVGTTHHYPLHDYLVTIGREVPLWMTEWGWSLDTFTEAQVATFVTQGLGLVNTYWPAFTEVCTYYSDRDTGGTHHGMFDDFSAGAAISPREAADAFAFFLGADDPGTSGPAGPRGVPSIARTPGSVSRAATGARTPAIVTRS